MKELAQIQGKELVDATECLILVSKKELCQHALNRLLFHEMPEVREAAAHAALFLSNKKTMNKLRKIAITDSNEFVRSAAKFTVEQLDKENGTANDFSG